MKRINKLPKTWVFFASPLGYDPYDTGDHGFYLNTEGDMTVSTYKGLILSAAERNQDVVNELAYEVVKPPVPTFDPSMTFG